VGKGQEEGTEPQHHATAEDDHVDDLQEQSLEGMEGRKLGFPFYQEDDEWRDPPADDLQNMGQDGHRSFFLRWRLNRI
jgi:hypothetical protein